MENLAPHITRRRLLIEGFYTAPLNKSVIKDYFYTISESLQLQIYGEPIIFTPGGEGKKENQGYDAFIPLIDSGISFYGWTDTQFISVIIYTCKDFEKETAIKVTEKFFKMDKIAWKDF